MLEKLKTNINKWNDEWKKFSVVKKQIIKNSFLADSISIDDKTLILVGEHKHNNGVEYGLFVDKKDMLNMAVCKTIFENNQEFWGALDSDEEFDEIWPIFIRKYYPDMADSVDEIIRNEFGKRYKEDEIRKEYEKLTKILIDKKLTITTMESATAGQIASLLTDCEGSSSVFPGSFVTYCNEAKVQCGVSATTIESHTVYSQEVAVEMALAAQKAFATDIAIGITGTMGNVDPNNPENSIPGKVHFAISKGEQINGYSVDIPVQSSRLKYKLAAAKEVSDVLIEMLESM